MNFCLLAVYFAASMKCRFIIGIRKVELENWVPLPDRALESVVMFVEDKTASQHALTRRIGFPSNQQDSNLVVIESERKSWSATASIGSFILSSKILTCPIVHMILI